MNAILSNLEQVIGAWKEVPRKAILVATLPSSLLWLIAAFFQWNSLVALLMFFLSGVPIVLSYGLFVIICILRRNYPSRGLFAAFFFTQIAVYLFIAAAIVRFQGGAGG